MSISPPDPEPLATVPQDENITSPFLPQTPRSPITTETCKSNIAVDYLLLKNVLHPDILDQPLADMLIRSGHRVVREVLPMKNYTPSSSTEGQDPREGGADVYLSKEPDEMILVFSQVKAIEIGRDVIDAITDPILRRFRVKEASNFRGIEEILYHICHVQCGVLAEKGVIFNANAIFENGFRVVNLTEDSTYPRVMIKSGLGQDAWGLSRIQEGRIFLQFVHPIAARRLCGRNRAHDIQENLENQPFYSKVLNLRTQEPCEISSLFYNRDVPEPTVLLAECKCGFCGDTSEGSKYIEDTIKLLQWQDGEEPCDIKINGLEEESNPAGEALVQTSAEEGSHEEETGSSERAVAEDPDSEMDRSRDVRTSEESYEEQDDEEIDGSEDEALRQLKLLRRYCRSAIEAEMCDSSGGTNELSGQQDSSIDNSFGLTLPIDTNISITDNAQISHPLDYPNTNTIPDTFSQFYSQPHLPMPLQDPVERSGSLAQMVSYHNSILSIEPEDLSKDNASSSFDFSSEYPADSSVLGINPIPPR